jgi:hypothetical protein
LWGHDPEGWLAASEHQELRVFRDQEVSSGRGGGFEEFLIVGIAAGGQRRQGLFRFEGLCEAVRFGEGGGGVEAAAEGRERTSSSSAVQGASMRISARPEVTAARMGAPEGSAKTRRSSQTLVSRTRRSHSDPEYSEW